MKSKAVLVALLFLLSGLILTRGTPGAAQQLQRPPQLPYEFAGGRPGVFRFHPQEQMRADLAEAAELRNGVERLRGVLPRISDPAAREQLQSELARWETHLSRLELRVNSSAGPTAATVESRLNGIKGARQCGVCHGQMDGDSGQ